jgi:hypothetical protein
VESRAEPVFKLIWTIDIEIEPRVGRACEIEEIEISIEAWAATAGTDEGACRARGARGAEGLGARTGGATRQEEGWEEKTQEPRLVGTVEWNETNHLLPQRFDGFRGR